MRRIVLPLLAGFAMLSACGESTPDTDTAGTDTTAGAVAGTGATAQSGETTRPRGFDPIDPATGTLELKAEGDAAGSWTFKDVNGSVTEQAGGGETRMTLQLESHNDPVHFKIRLMSSDGDIRPGRYTIGSSSRAADATYENGGRYYKATGGGASGHVELTKISDDRATGAYEMTLETLDEPKQSARVAGSFDMRVQR